MLEDLEKRREPKLTVEAVLDFVGEGTETQQATVGPTKTRIRRICTIGQKVAQTALDQVRHGLCGTKRRPTVLVFDARASVDLMSPRVTM
jgi:hypothetical protein